MSSSVFRLKKTWEKLSKQVEAFSLVVRVLTTFQNYPHRYEKLYRCNFRIIGNSDVFREYSGKLKLFRISLIVDFLDKSYDWQAARFGQH